MSDLQLQIRISADGKAAKAELVSVSGEVGKLGRSASSSTGGVAALGSGLDKLAASGRSSETQIRNTVSAITGKLLPAAGQAEAAANKASAGFDRLGGSFGRMAAAVGGVAALTQAVRSLNDASDRVSLMDARLKLVSNSAEQFRAVQASLYQQSQTLGTGIEGQTALYVKLARATEGTERASRDLLQVTKTIGQGLKISGASAQEQSAALLQLAQGMASGKLQGDELRSVLEGMPVVADAIERSLGLAKGGLRDFAAEGKLTTDVFIDAALKIKNFDAQVAAMPKTFGDAFTRMSNSVLEWSAAMSKSLGVTEAFTNAFNQISYRLDRSAGRTDPRADAIRDVQEAYLKLFKAQSDFDRTGATAYRDAARRAEEQVARANAALEQLTSQAKEAATAADPLAEGFGKAAYEASQVGRRYQDTILAIRDQAKKAGVDIAASLALAGHESGFRQYDAAGKVLGSSAGPSSAKGIYQIINGTAAGLGIDANDPFQNIKGGIDLLGKLEQKYGSLAKAVTAYYIGEGELNKMLKARGSINLDFVPKGNKTSVGAYLADVEKRFNEFQQKYPSGLTFWDEKSLGDQTATARKLFDQQIATANSVAEAQKTIAKSARAVDLETLEQRRKAYANFSKSVASDLKGDALISQLRQSAEVEKQLLRESSDLKQQAIADEERVVQARIDGINKELDSAGRLERSEFDRMSLLDKRRAAEAELATLADQRRAIAVAASGEEVSLAQGVADAILKEESNIRAAADARDEYVARIEAQIAAIQTGNDVMSQEAELHKMSSDMAREDAKAWEDKIRARLAYLNVMKKSRDEQEKEAKAVREDQLRMNAVFDDAAKQAREFSNAMKEAFDSVGDGIGGLVVAFADYNQRMYQASRDTENAIEAGWRNLQAAVNEGNAQAAYSEFMKATEIEQQARMQETLKLSQYQVAAFGDMAQAARGFFAEGSAGYNAMSNAMKVLRIVEAAFTVASIAQSFSRGQAKAAEAVANQASGGDPYSAFPRMAAMAAAMAALGFGVAGAFAGGGSSRPTAESRQKSLGSGTVFGDANAQSASILNALEILRDNSSTDLSYSAGMLRALQNIEYSMSGVTNSVIRNVGPAQIEGLGSRPMFSGVQKAMLGMDMILGDILWRTTKKITDWGIAAFPQALQTILEAGFKGMTYTEVTTTNKFLGMTIGESVKTVRGQLDSEVERNFTGVIRSMADALKEGGQSFGLSADSFLQKMSGFVVNFDTLSLKGLKGEELQQAIESMFSKVADEMARAFFPNLDEFQRVGEGYAETFFRVAEGIDRAGAELDALGVNAIKYSEIQFKQGDVAAEIVRQSIVAFEGLESGVGQFVALAVGSAEELIATYQDLLSARDILKGLGLDWQNLNRSMTDAAGGVGKFLDALESFRDNFYSAGEQYAADLTTLAREFGNLGLALPASKDEFRALAESIDTSTAAGAELFARIIKLSEAFASAADRAEDLERKYRSYTDPFADFADRIDTVLTDFKDILDARLGNIEAEYASQASLAKKQANDPLQGRIDSLTGYIGTRQSEVAQDYANIATATSRITELQGLIDAAFRSGNSKLAGYVQSWRAEIESLGSMIGTLNADISAKTAEITKLNGEISELQRQIAANSADIDAGQLGDKLRDLTEARREILRERGDALVRTMQEIWENVIGVINDAQNSLNRQIAELQGPRALSQQSLGVQRDALGALNQYRKAGGDDPNRLIDLVTDAQDAIMQHYNDRYQVLMAKAEREARQQERAINQQLLADTRAVEQQANQQIRSIRRAGEAAIEAYRAQIEAQIDGINAAMDAAAQALEDRQQAEQDALQDAQDARMELLKDEQAEVQKLLQKRQKAELKVLQDQLATAQQLQQAYRQIADYARNLKTGGLSSLSPQDKLAEAQSQYAALFGKAQGGDAEAAGKLSSAADTYLQLAQQYYGSGTQYADIYQGVQQAMEGLGNMVAVTDPIEAAIEALQESQEQELEDLRKAQEVESRALQKVFRDESRALSRSQQDASEALRKTFQDRIDAVQKQAQRIEERMQRETDRQIEKIENQTQRTIAKMEREAQRQIDAITDPNKNPALKDLKDKTIAKLQSLNEVLADARNRAADQAQTQIQYLANMEVLNRRQLTQLKKIARQLTNDGSDYPTYATGGYHPGGYRIVGERGPELEFTGPARIISNSEARQAIGQSDARIIARLEAVIAELKALVTTQSASNPRLVSAVEGLATETSRMRRDQKIKPMATA